MRLALGLSLTFLLDLRLDVYFLNIILVYGHIELSFGCCDAHISPFARIIKNS